MNDWRSIMSRGPRSRWSRRTAALAKRLDVAEHVCFAGDVPNASVPALIQQARLLAFPTWCESFGLPLAEALAMGAPAVAADIPACREVGGEAAAYYSPGDVGSLTGAMDDLLRFPEATLAMAELAYERGKMFSWRDNAIGVRQTLEKALS
jgi:glycosyltransferase involved in cell wall biosynthesis